MINERYFIQLAPVNAPRNLTNNKVPFREDTHDCRFTPVLLQDRPENSLSCQPQQMNLFCNCRFSS